MRVRRFGIHTDNFVESLNAWLLQERGLSCLEMLIAIWNKVSDRKASRLLELNKVLANPMQHFTPYAVSVVGETTSHTNGLRVRLSGVGLQGRVTEIAT